MREHAQRPGQAGTRPLFAGDRFPPSSAGYALIAAGLPHVEATVRRRPGQDAAAY